ncbi:MULTISPECIES: ABC transporter ATP-binding protein [Latilactobacillus]|uniref:ABC transporter ATP-binding protein n=1 Tax=Latilactobacillus TaxID=2767885 RepID=UPI00202FF87E|nr:MULTISPECIES: ABC transporter ATP-binding protein [Latilactobacillus]MCM1598411.1 ABC transporter ATP-binding protein [Latilactobacillus sakei]MCP8863750.1 ABC transporter ATP-binding protein [Latilactobacillus curvatus]MCT3527294.1 ABC transporter ATP-binding protein [Latilactobacillus curvatus]MDG2986921.1 ABC transporter ATP-binding protein [Latilactobacillus curvatus]UTC07867.1 multidrug ABC transporter ATP-binding protein [Latilactobacillus curvatus]
MQIEINNLVVTYKNNVALDLKNLTIPNGGAYGIVGHNGAGKTTLFKSLTNIITNYSGEIQIDGQNVRDNPAILNRVGIVLDGMSVYMNQTGWFNLAYFSGLRGEFNREQARTLAAEIGIEAVLNQKVKTYSYGMKKKLILLIALLHQPELLILDEPFRGLDLDTVQWFKTYLQKLISEGSMTLLISSHVQSDIEMFCQSVFVIDHGQLRETIDLATESDKKLRVVDTTDNVKVQAILTEMAYEHEVLADGRIQLSIKDPKWREVQMKLIDAEIEINEIGVLSALDNKLN